MPNSGSPDMFWRRRKRLEEEVESHLAEETADNIARGMNPDAARFAALRAFGNPAAARERARELDPLYWLDTLWQDTRFAFRLIFTNRWMSATIVGTLTVGIALNVSVFTLLNALLLRPWVRTQPETFVSLHPQFSGEYALRYSDGGMSQPDYVRYRDSARSLVSLAAYRPVTLTLSGPESGSIRAGLISCNFFGVIGQGPPIAGRYLRTDECATRLQAPVVVVSETFWRSQFRADHNAIGRVLYVNRIPMTLVGVAPDISLNSAAPGAQVNLWLPYTMLGSVRPAEDYFSDPRAQWLNVIGRRKPKYSLEQAQQELSVLAHRADEAVPGRVTSLVLTDGSLAQMPGLRERAALIIAVILGSTILLLLLGCVNVTTLLLSRAAARQREIAVRLSLGAGRFRLLRQLLTESLVLSTIAAAFSLAIAQHAPAALWHSLRLGPAPFDMTPDLRVLLYCAGIAVLTGLIAGLSPAIDSLRPQVAESLKGSSASVTPGRRRSRLRSALVAVQVAVSLVLLVEAALFVRAQRSYLSYDPGFETRQVLSLTLASVLTGFNPPKAFYQELESRVHAVPAVVQTAYTSPAPWLGRSSSEITEIDGKPMPRTRDFRRDPARRSVTPEYFRVLDIPLIRGRVFRRDEARVDYIPVVISEAMTRRYWPDQDPVNRTFRTNLLHQVVGVCQDVQSIGFMRPDGPFYYAPLDATRSNPPVMLVRVLGDAQRAAASIRNVVRQIDPQMATTEVTLSSMIESQAESLQPVLLHGSIAGSLALLLALTGVYGVVSISVSQRIPEIGIRVALGAQRRDVLTLVLRSGLAPVCLGLLAGFGLAIVVSLRIEAMLFGFNPYDPLTLVLVPLLLLGAAFGAIWIPARRAAALDALRSLRYE
jgi:macrolide transport system ATP-binding/permease protein